MTDENELITVTSHLKKDEADRIKGILNSIRINSIISGHDAASRYSSLYYQIRVKREDFRSAKQIIDKEKAKIFIEGKKCPKCDYSRFFAESPASGTLRFGGEISLKNERSIRRRRTNEIHSPEKR